MLLVVRRALFIVAWLVAIAGCGASQPLEIDVSCTAFEGQPSPVVVDGGQVEPAVGESFTVSLCSNPSTGYSWSEDVGYDRAVLELADREFVSGTAASPPAVGAAGSEVFTFEVIGKGSTTIEMTYGRSFEPDQPPAWTYRLPVLVD